MTFAVYSSVRKTCKSMYARMRKIVNWFVRKFLRVSYCRTHLSNLHIRICTGHTAHVYIGMYSLLARFECYINISCAHIRYSVPILDRSNGTRYGRRWREILVLCRLQTADCRLYKYVFTGTGYTQGTRTGRTNTVCAVYNCICIRAIIIIIIIMHGNDAVYF